MQFLPFFAKWITLPLVCFMTFESLSPSRSLIRSFVSPQWWECKWEPCGYLGYGDINKISHITYKWKILEIVFTTNFFLILPLTHQFVSCIPMDRYAERNANDRLFDLGRSPIHTHTHTFFSYSFFVVLSHSQFCVVCACGEKPQKNRQTNSIM